MDGCFRERLADPRHFTRILSAAGEASADVTGCAIHEEDNGGASAAVECDLEALTQWAREVRRHQQVVGPEYRRVARDVTHDSLQRAIGAARRQHRKPGVVRAVGVIAVRRDILGLGDTDKEINALYASPRRRDRFSRCCNEQRLQFAVETIDISWVQTRHHTNRSTVGVRRAKSQLRLPQMGGSRHGARERGIDGGDVSSNNHQACFFVLEDKGANHELMERTFRHARSRDVAGERRPDRDRKGKSGDSRAPASAVSAHGWTAASCSPIVSSQDASGTWPRARAAKISAPTAGGKRGNRDVAEGHSAWSAALKGPSRHSPAPNTPPVR